MTVTLFDQHVLHFIVRWVHVTSMAFVLSDALLLWSVPVQEEQTVLRAAEQYERLFWAAMGLLVVTGIGNLGVFGAGLHAPIPFKRIVGHSGQWGGINGALILLIMRQIEVPIENGRTIFVTFCPLPRYTNATGDMSRRKTHGEGVVCNPILTRRHPATP